MKPPLIQLPKTSLAVRYETALCDRHGRIERILQRGENMITDWGMDQMAAANLGVLTSGNIAYLHLGSTTETLKRVLPGGNSITINAADPAAVTVVAVTNFFEAGDVGRTLKIAAWAELLVTGYTDAQNITCKSRASLWPPGFSPPGSGPYTDAAIHYTSVSTMASEFTRFNTYDTSSANNNAELNDSANSRVIHQRIYLSAVVTGTAWTVNELGWGPNTTNCFGKANLGSPDVVAVGKRYRVQLQVFHAYTPIDLTGVVLDWGATVGSYTCAIRQERIGFDEPISLGGAPANISANFLRPATPAISGVGWWTAAFTLSSIAWCGDAGFTTLSGRTGRVESSTVIFDSAYTSGDFRRTRTARWPDTVTITAAVGLYAGLNHTGTGAAHWPSLTIKPASGTITKAGGYRIDILFSVVWQRTLVN